MFNNIGGVSTCLIIGGVSTCLIIGGVSTCLIILEAYDSINMFLKNTCTALFYEVQTLFVNQLLCGRAKELFY